MIELVKCSKCGEIKPMTSEHFHRNKQSKTGFRPDCKSCCNNRAKKHYEKKREVIGKKQKRYREENKEEILEYQKEYYKRNKEGILTYQKKYQQKNRERLVEYDREYYIENRARIKRYSRKYYLDNIEDYRNRAINWKENNPERYRELSRKSDHIRRAREREIIRSYSKLDWENTKECFEHSCAYCGVRADSLEAPLEQDHIVPISKGGDHVVGNVVPSCRSCNASKGAKWLGEWYPGHENYSKKRYENLKREIGKYEKGQEKNLC